MKFSWGLALEIFPMEFPWNLGSVPMECGDRDYFDCRGGMSAFAFVPSDEAFRKAIEERSKAVAECF